MLILKGLGRKPLNVWTSKCLDVELGKVGVDSARRSNAQIAERFGEMGVELSKTILPQKYYTCQDSFERNLEVVERERDSEGQLGWFGST